MHLVCTFLLTTHLSSWLYNNSENVGTKSAMNRMLYKFVLAINSTKQDNENIYGDSENARTYIALIKMSYKFSSYIFQTIQFYRNSL